MGAVPAQPGVEAVVFDLGGVLIDWNPRHVYRQLFAGDEAAMEEFLGAVCTLTWHHQHDLGRPMADSCAELVSRHPERAELIWAWRDRAEDMIAGAIDSSVGILVDLQDRGVPCYALTNWPAETFGACRRRFDFLSCFDGIVVSGEEGVAKPDPEIFLRLLGRYRLKAGSTLFLDDHEPHVASARSLGMQAVLFDRPETVRRRLGDLGLLPAA